MRKLLIAFVVIFTGVTDLFACQCMELKPLSKHTLEIYDVIFVGDVIAVSGDDLEAKASFKVKELYKGSSYQQITVQYDAKTDCGMNFIPGETWIIYGKWIEYGVPRADMCGHSRVIPKAGQPDYYETERGKYTDDLKWLQDSLGIQPFIDPNDHKDLAHKNTIPDATQALTYLIAGLGGLAAIFYFVRRMFKRDGH